jgi:UDP-4-amino-4-deoxy-L-arabinose formyltransferase/UDP-glucuronic acid dehydrogenase (UDP-4-keto-hexauronic acid decarboxylating)
VLVNGETETGVTLHYMTRAPDAGDIVCQRRTAITDDDTAVSLTEKLVAEAGIMLDEYLPRIRAGTAPRVPQDHAAATVVGRRRPADGEIDWRKPATAVRNLIRAVTQPYPGAFSHVGDRKCFVWAATRVDGPRGAEPGTIVSTTPLVVACGQDAVRVDFAQTDGGVYVTRSQLASTCRLVQCGSARARDRAEAARKQRVLIWASTASSRFLSERLLDAGAYRSRHGPLVGHDRSPARSPGLPLHEGDIAIHREWIEYHIKKCDVIIPLVAIATPIEYVRHPLRVFELDFEENLRVVRYCVKYGKRIVFPSTSEVYGMCDDEVFDEDRSTLVLGPIRMQRWIYSCSKQLLDRVIWAYGPSPSRFGRSAGSARGSFTSARIGLLARGYTSSEPGRGLADQLVDEARAALHRRLEASSLYRIIENADHVCDRQIVNIGNPTAVRHPELAEILLRSSKAALVRRSAVRGIGDRQRDLLRAGTGRPPAEHRNPSARPGGAAVPFDQSVEKRRLPARRARPSRRPARFLARRARPATSASAASDRARAPMSAFA